MGRHPDVSGQESSVPNAFGEQESRVVWIPIFMGMTAEGWFPPEFTPMNIGAGMTERVFRKSFV